MECKRYEAEEKTDHSCPYSANVKRLKQKLITISPYSANVKRPKQKLATYSHTVPTLRIY